MHGSDTVWAQSCAGEEDDQGHNNDPDVQLEVNAVMFHSAPTLMFMAILFHDAFGSPRFTGHTSVFERST